MKLNLDNLFDASQFSKPLFIFEMANNHMGNLKHGLKIINDFHKVAKKFNFRFAFKFQFRNIPTFIHPDYQKRVDIKYVKRFSETRLLENQFRTLKKELVKKNFITVCTPFDEPSVDLIEKIDFDIIKVGSCSLTDWPLLERIVKSNKPIIASTGGVELVDIDRVVSFFQHRKKKFAIMHCVGEYPTMEKNLQLNQIDLFKQRYPDVVIGYSTHEEPNNFDAIKVAIGKNARIFEKHVALKTKKYEPNSYSVLPEQAEGWLQSAKQAYIMNGVKGKRIKATIKELSDLRQFKRGVFAKKQIEKDELINQSNIFYAWPNHDNQLVANDMAKYNQYLVKKPIKPNAPIFEKDVKLNKTRQKVMKIVKESRNILKKANIVLPNKLDFEISHHYGIDKFFQFGMVIITCVNRDYCKKLLVFFPNQKHPTQYHKIKEETFHVLYGKFEVKLNNKKHILKKGDILTIEKNIKHQMKSISKGGGVLEEISSTHYKSDSFYLDKKVQNNKNRKACLTYWKQI